MVTGPPFVKTFSTVIAFTEVLGEGWFPMVHVTLIKAGGERRQLKLLFDTGATQITLRSDHEWLFPGVSDQDFDTGAGTITGRLATSQTIEFLGVTINCDIGFLPLGQRAWVGVCGRNCFKPFGFGFWEDARKLYVTLKP